MPDLILSFKIKMKITLRTLFNMWFWEMFLPYWDLKWLWLQSIWLRSPSVTCYIFKSSVCNELLPIIWKFTWNNRYSIVGFIPWSRISQPWHYWHYLDNLLWVAILCIVGICNTITGLYPLDASSTHHHYLLCNLTIRNTSRHDQNVPWAAESPPVENHCPRPSEIFLKSAEYQFYLLLELVYSILCGDFFSNYRT